MLLDKYLSFSLYQKLVIKNHFTLISERVEAKTFILSFQNLIIIIRLLSDRLSNDKIQIRDSCTEPLLYQCLEIREHWTNVGVAKKKCDY